MFLSIECSPKLLCLVYKNPPLIPIQSWAILTLILISFSFKVHFNASFDASSSGLPVYFCVFGFFDQTSLCILIIFVFTLIKLKMSNSCQNFLPNYIFFCPFTARHKYPLKYILVETKEYLYYVVLKHSIFVAVKCTYACIAGIN
jgi:hypothetical protein